MKRLGTALALLMATGAAAQACETTLRVSDNHPDGYPTVEAVKSMAAEVKAKTSDRICIEVFPASQLGEEKDTIEQTQFGVIDMVRASFGTFSDIVPDTQLFSLPYLFASDEQMHHVMDGQIGDDLAKKFEAKDFVALAWYDGGARSFYNSKKPITKLEDLKGMKFRVIQNDVFVAMMEALGGTATPMPFGEVYSAIQTGVIDGAENNFPSYDSSGHYEVAKYFTLDQHLIVPEVVAMSKKSWDKLKPEDQEIIRAAAKASATKQRELWAAAEKASEDKVVAGGAQIVREIDKKPFMDAMAPVYDRFVTTPEAKAVVEAIRAVK